MHFDVKSYFTSFYRRKSPQAFRRVSLSPEEKPEQAGVKQQTEAELKLRTITYIHYSIPANNATSYLWRVFMEVRKMMEVTLLIST